MSNKVCQVCGRNYKKAVTDFHLKDEHKLSREDYNTLLTDEVVEEVKKLVDEPDAETPSQTPSPEPEEEPEPEVEEPEPEVVPEPARKTNKVKILYQLGPWNRKKYFLDPVTKFRINKRGKPGDKMPLPSKITPAIKKAIERKIIVPAEE